MNSPTGRLVAGLVFTLLVIGAYAAYTLHSVSRMRQVQTGIVDRNRKGSLQLIRIQNDLNSLALAMRDMLDNPDRYPLNAWKAPLNRIRQNLDDAIKSESALAEGRRSPQQTAFLKSSFEEFWRASDEVLAFADRGDERKSRELVRAALQPRQEALTALTARLLVANNDEETRAGQQVGEIYSQVENNVYRFLGVSVVLIALTSLGLIRSNRATLAQLTDLADQRKELARQLISTQESTLRAISRDLHDEFGQILTALGAMLRRADKHAPGTEYRAQVQEASQIVQGTLENIRSLSQSLQPVMLDEQGLLPTIEWHLPVFERQTGIRVRYRPPERGFEIAPDASVHVYRILQEALNNVARHAGVDEVAVSIEADDSFLTLRIEDEGKGLPDRPKLGVGLSAMRERAGLIGGTLDIARGERGGTSVRLRLPVGVSREAQIAR